MKIFTIINFNNVPILLARGIYPVEKFIFGVALGMAGGALMVANNCKLRNLVKKNQDDLMQKAEQYIDSKLEQLENKE